MKRRLLGLAIALFAVQTASAQTWHEDWDKATALAKKSGRPILADFTGSDWCGWCIRLKDEVFETSEFRQWAAKNVVLLELDFPRKKSQSDELKKQNKALKQKYGIRGYPTILFLDAEGKVLGRSGYRRGGPEAWIEHAKTQMSGTPEEAEPKAEKGDLSWLTSYDEAAALSKKTGKPMLVDFTGSDWCGWCIRLDREVFDTEEFASWAKEHVIPVKIDFPRKKRQTDEVKAANAKLRDKYGVRGYPTILILDAEGKRLGKLGYQKGGPGPWIKVAERYVGTN